MAYENFTSFYDVETQVYIPDYSYRITSTRGAGPFPYTDLVPSISIRCAGSYDWPNCGRACCLEGSAYSLNYTADIVAYDPSDSSKYAVCNYRHPTLTKEERSGSTEGYRKGYLKLPEQVISLPLTASAWDFYGGLSSLSKNLAIAIVVHQEYYSADLANYVNVRAGTTSSTWLQFEHTVISERYANSIDTYPLFADRSTKDQNGDVIDTTYLKIADLPAIPTAGRNMNLNQYGAMQTNLPGGLFDAPASQSNDFERLNGADFAGAFRLACRHNTSDNYELAIAYTASGMTSSYSFIGTETIIALDNTVTTKQAAYIGESCYYTPTVKFGGYTSTAFDPTRHKAIIYNGIGQIGPTSDCKIAIYSDANSNVKIAFTAIEVGKVGSTT